jgi:molybdopterin-biosynthesis enzyme MoeA-like protein
VVEAQILRDDEVRIAQAVRGCHGRCSAVVTMGGIGPTHDDVTIKAIAAGLNRRMKHSDDMHKLLLSLSPPTSPEGESNGWDISRMCDLPQGTRRQCLGFSLVNYTNQTPLLAHV